MIEAGHSNIIEVVSKSSFGFKVKAAARFKPKEYTGISRI